MVKLNASQIWDAVEAVDNIFETLSKNSNDDQALQEILTAINDINSESPALSIKKIAMSLWLISKQGDCFALSLRDFKLVIDFLTVNLRLLDIKTYDNSLSFLHGHLYYADSLCSWMKADHWQSIWYGEKAMVYADQGFPQWRYQWFLNLGKRYLRVGLATNAESSLQQAENAASDATQFYRARIERIRVIRLGKDFGTAKALSMRLLAMDDIDARWLERAEWELIAANASHSNNLTEMMSAISKRGNHRNYYKQLLATLYSSTCDSPRWMDKPLKPESIRKMLKPRISQKNNIGKQDPFFDAVVQLNRCYDTTLAVGLRLQYLERALDKAPTVHSAEEELLILAASARWLHRKNQNVLLTSVKGRYQKLSLSLTNGKSTDSLNLLQSLENDSIETWIDDSDEIKPRKKPSSNALNGPTSALGRSIKVARVGAYISGVLVKQKLTKLTTKNTQKLLESEQECYFKVIDYMLTHLSAMKGPLMKLVQLAGFYGFQLPEELQSKMLDIYDCTATMDQATVDKIIEEEFGKKREDLFPVWNEIPIAAASMAQVHKAELKNGRIVAVKVKFPSIDKQIEADFRLVKLIEPILNRLFPNVNITDHIAVNWKAIINEGDFVKEAKNTNLMKKNLSKYRDVVVPEAIESLTTKNVMTLDFIDGISVREFSESATPAERATAASTLLRVTFQSLLRHGFVNADPHPGNFLLLPGGRVGLIDFGACLSIDDDHMESYQACFSSLVENNFESFKIYFNNSGYGFGLSADQVQDQFLTLREIVADVFPDGSTSQITDATLDKIQDYMGPNGHGKLKVGLLPKDYWLPRFIVMNFLTLNILRGKGRFDLDVLPFITAGKYLAKPQEFSA